jgi:hypothetical protein
LVAKQGGDPRRTGEGGADTYGSEVKLSVAWLGLAGLVKLKVTSQVFRSECAFVLYLQPWDTDLAHQAFVLSNNATSMLFHPATWSNSQVPFRHHHGQFLKLVLAAVASQTLLGGWIAWPAD